MVDARVGCVRPLHDHARQHRRERCSALDRDRPGAAHARLGTRVGRIRVRPLVRGPDARRREARGHARTTTDLRHRSRDLRGLVACVWSRGERGVLIAARVVQGVGAAFMLPATLSIISATFPPRLRGTAIGIWAGVSALALAIGPLVGGLITEHISWNWIFYINVPVGALGIFAALTIIRESRDTSHEQRLDVPGLITSGVSFLAVTFAVIESNRYGWGSPTILGLFGWLSSLSLPSSSSS